MRLTLLADKSSLIPKIEELGFKKELEGPLIINTYELPIKNDKAFVDIIDNLTIGEKLKLEISWSEFPSGWIVIVKEK